MRPRPRRVNILWHVHGGTTEEGNCSYLVPLSHCDVPKKTKTDIWNYVIVNFGIVAVQYVKKCVLSNAPVTSHSRAPNGLFPGCSWAVLNKNCTSTHEARMGPVRRRTKFPSPYGARRVLMHAFWAYGPRTGLGMTNSLWTARVRPVRGPCDHLRHPRVTFANSGPARHPFGSCTGPVGYEKHWRFPYGVRTTPARASHGVHVESCELFDQTISVQPCQAVRCP